MTGITPFLWFDSNAEEAANFYTSIFMNSSIGNVSRYGEDGPGPAGSVLVMEFKINGQGFMALNGGPMFKFTEAVSFVVSCENQEEIDYYWEKLSEGEAEQQCGWLRDKFGLSWQIVPTILGQLMTDPDPEKSGRVMKALLQMVKLDIAGLKRAYENA